MRRYIQFTALILMITVFTGTTGYAQRITGARDIGINPVRAGITPGIIVTQPTENAILSETFDGNFPPTNWTIANPQGGTGWQGIEVGTTPIPGWNGGTITSPFGPGGVAYCTWNTAGPNVADQYLITPQLTLGPQMQLDFWIQRQPVTYSDSVQILLSTTGNQPGDFNIVLEDIAYFAYDNLTEWTHHVIDLSAYAGDDVYIAFREHYYSTLYVSVISLDQVTVGSIPSVPVTYLNYSGAEFGTVDVGQSKTLEGFKLTNIGGGTLTVNEVLFSNSTFTSSISPGDVSLGAEEQYDFTITYSPVAQGNDDGIMSIVTNVDTLLIYLAGSGFQLPEGMIQVGHENWIGLGLPMDPSWDYTYSQTIYKQENLNVNGERITKIGYQYVYEDYYGGSGEPFTDNIKIYMAHTQDDVFTNWIPINEMILVYDGVINIPGGNEPVWIELTLDFPFAYNNVDNLVVAFDENSVGLHSWNDYFMCSATEDLENIACRTREMFDIDPLNPGAPGPYSIINYYPNTRFQFEELAPEPLLVVLPDAVDYGYRETGYSYTAEVTITNFGGTDLQINSVDGITAPFSTNFQPITLSSGEVSEPVIISFNPVSTGLFNQTITFGSNATNNNNVVTLKGYAYPDPYITQFPYVMGFEGNDAIFPAYGWDNKAEKQWIRGLIPAVGNYSAGATEYEPGEAIMMTPYISLPDSFRISFWWADNNNAFPEGKSPRIIGHDTTFFQASLDHGTTWTDLAVLSTESPEQWHKDYFDMSAWASDSLLLRWRDVTDGDYYLNRGVALDEIIIEYNNPNPTAAINNNVWNASVILVGDTTHSGNIFTLQNIDGGILTISAVTGLEGTDFATTIIPQDVSLGLGETYSFGFSYSSPDISVDNAVCVIETNGGTLYINLLGEAQTIGEFTSESFDGDIFPPLGWKNIDADGDGYKWLQHNDPDNFPPHSGTGSAYSESWSTIGGSLWPDNYFITPPFTVTDQKNEFAWWVNSHWEWFMDHYSVSVVPAGTLNPADFIQLFMENNFATEWTLRHVSLNDYMGQEIRIAFRHYWSHGRFQVLIDDVAAIPEGTANRNDMLLNNSVLVYPNPVKDFITLKSDDVIHSVSFYSTTSGLIAQYAINDKFYKINCSNLQQGLYILKIETDKGTIGKLVNVVK